MSDDLLDASAPKQKNPPAATRLLAPTPSLAERIAAVREEIAAIIDARTAIVMKESPGSPFQVIRNMITRQAGICPCSQYVQLMEDDRIQAERAAREQKAAS